MRFSFLLACFLMLFAAMFTSVFALTTPAEESTIKVVLLVGSMAFFTLSCYMLVLPDIVASRSRAILSLSEMMNIVSQKLSDVNVIRRQHDRAIDKYENLMLAMSQNIEAFQVVFQKVFDAANRIRQTEDELGKTRSDLDGKKREYEKLKERIISFIASLQNAKEHKEINPEALKTISKISDDIERMVEDCGYEPIRPQKGDKFNERLHVHFPREEKPSDKDIAGTVASTVKEGYRWSGDVIEKALVRVYSDSGKSVITPEEQDKSPKLIEENSSNEVINEVKLTHNVESIDKEENQSESGKEVNQQ